MTDSVEIRRTRQPAPVLEIGGTHVTAALVDVRARRVLPGTKCRQPMRAGASAEEIVDRVLGCASRLEAPPKSRWGIAIPGPFDYARGIALFEGVAKFDALYGVDLGKILIERLPGRPSKVSFLNDASAFALGEWAAGAARGHDRAVGITLGTGVGSAFLSQGSLVDDGPDVPPQGWVHLLKFAGHPLEHSISRRAIMNRYADIAKPAPADVILDVREIAGRARTGDLVARRVMDDAFSALGRTVGPWLTRFHATVLVVGGSMAASWDLIARPMQEGLLRMETELLSRLVLTQARQPEDAALLGAAWYAAGDLSELDLTASPAQALTTRRPL
ncbi:ROK family protein [Micromonospora sp. DT47]|uniref:ROK family protein n=1 Tax=Micromonospora sp. DT47 TaxID=3393431 RepID=UPI003CF80253